MQLLWSREGYSNILVLIKQKVNDMIHALFDSQQTQQQRETEMKSQAADLPRGQISSGQMS